MKVKTLLIATAALEIPTGIVLIFLPALVSALLLGAPLDPLAGATVARVAGAALLSLGCLCGFARNDEKSGTQRGLITALTIYNAAVVIVLIYARLAAHLFGIGIWPAVALHTALAIACIRLQR